MKALMSWSSGKDSAWALHAARAAGLPVTGLLTTFNAVFGRVAMHGVRRELVEAQAESIGLPLWPVPLPWPCPNEQYEAIMAGVCRQAAAQGIEAIVFGDLFLEDIRAYRERQLEGTGLSPVFPLWKLSTPELARLMIASGLRAKVACLDPKFLPETLAGRDWDSRLLDALPPGIDPCGERGEFHTFVYDGPMFRGGLAIEVGEIVERDGFVFADMVGARHDRATARNP